MSGVPGVVQAYVASVAGGLLVGSWDAVDAGHTNAMKWRIGGAFVKASDQTQARAQIDREARTLAALDGSFSPRVLGAAVRSGWSILVLEDLTEAHWPPPFPDDSRDLLGTLEALAATTPPPQLRRRPAGRPNGLYWTRLAREGPTLERAGICTTTYLEKAITALETAETRAELAGDDFVHGDIWAGNICFAGRGALLIDWAAAEIADHRLDLGSALLAIRAAGGEAPPVPFEDEPAYAALLAGANAWQSIQPLPAIRGASRLAQLWLLNAGAALRWAAELLELDRPE